MKTTESNLLLQPGMALLHSDELKQVHGGAKSYGEELCEQAEEAEQSQSKE